MIGRIHFPRPQILQSKNNIKMLPWVEERVLLSRSLFPLFGYHNHINNQAVVQIINKKSSKSPQVIVFVRKFVLDTLHFNIKFRAKYINTKLKTAADSISRCQWLRFCSLDPHTDSGPTPPPQKLADLTVETRGLQEVSLSSNI